MEIRDIDPLSWVEAFLIFLKTGTRREEHSRGLTMLRLPADLDAAVFEFCGIRAQQPGKEDPQVSADAF